MEPSENSNTSSRQPQTNQNITTRRRLPRSYRRPIALNQNPRAALPNTTFVQAIQIERLSNEILTAVVSAMSAPNRREDIDLDTLYEIVSRVRNIELYKLADLIVFLSRICLGLDTTVVRN